MATRTQAPQARRGALMSAVVAVLPKRLRSWIRRRRHADQALAGPADVRWSYRLLLGREPDDHGRKGYESLVLDHPIARSDLVSFFVSSPEFRAHLERHYEGYRLSPVAVEVGHLTVYVDPDDGAIGAFLRRDRIYEPAVTALVRARLRPGGCFVDVGASFGYFTAIASSIVGADGRVVAVEPGPQNQTLLRLNAMSGGSLNAEVVQMALSDERGVVRYGRSGANGTILDFDGDPESVGSYDLVATDTLDNLIGDSPVHLVKIDVEGAEGRVLRGATSVLTRQRPDIVFEFSPPSLAMTSDMSGEQLLELLRGFGYRFDLVRSDPGDVRPRTTAEVLREFDSVPGDHVDVIAWPGDAGG